MISYFSVGPRQRLSRIGLARGCAKPGSAYRLPAGCADLAIAPQAVNPTGARNFGWRPGVAGLRPSRRAPREWCSRRSIRGRVSHATKDRQTSSIPIGGRQLGARICPAARPRPNRIFRIGGKPPLPAASLRAVSVSHNTTALVSKGFTAGVASEKQAENRPPALTIKRPPEGGLSISPG